MLTNTGIHNAKSGNKVPRSDGARPCMDLPTAFPDDVDFDWSQNASLKFRSASRIVHGLSYVDLPSSDLNFKRTIYSNEIKLFHHKLA